MATATNSVSKEQTLYEKTATFARDSKDQAKQAAIDAKHKVDEASEKTSEYVTKNPLKSVGIAFAAGVVLTALLKK